LACLFVGAPGRLLPVCFYLKKIIMSKNKAGMCRTCGGTKSMTKIPNEGLAVGKGFKHWGSLANTFKNKYGHLPNGRV